MSQLRRGVARLRDPENELANEQMMVSELMQTSPSSSFEESAYRDGYMYNQHDRELSSSPTGGYGSDEEAAGAAVSSSQSVDAPADLIVKEDVPERKEESEHASLLSKGLAAVQITDMPGGGGKEDPSSSGDHVVEGSLSEPSTGGCTCLQLVERVLTECKACQLQSSLNQPTGSYDLRIADEDWDPDLDFPALDSAAAVIDVGVDHFVLCPKGVADPLLYIRIALHQPLKGSLGGSGAMDVPGSGANMTLEVNFRTPTETQEEEHHISFDIAADPPPEPMHFMEPRLRGSMASSEAEDHTADTPKLRNIDTGEEYPMREIDKHVPRGISPKELFGRV